MLDCKNRRKEILSYIEKNKHVSIEELVSFFNVNDQVIYRDLIYLEKIKKIKRTSKGAIFPELKAKEAALKLSYRETIFYKEKEEIGKFASTLIKDGESLMIDGGSTTFVFATNLINKNRLMVITNTSTIGSLLKKGARNRVILTGGELIQNSLATTGEIAESVLSQYKVNKAVIGVCSIDVEKGGFYTGLEDEAHIKQNMIKSANEVIILADSSKLSRKEPFLVCNFNTSKKITLITDKEIPLEQKTILENNKIKIISVN
ncbi:MAG: DeoR/GlpR family DNA-binding transcription regulator [Sphaerochaetaceae bacterium]|nr:DeoR/GlpR family DNA-binding transcription regulator [Sphaerochaetaceae bacterium]MDC7236953.1 DeoR/GlpR family DNA-binding transcription regulator [Sphaerochaetaceae bacterium]MDC7248922.1 DeoR/GlpR family DNA-binding transcription regulator [Sphaerochaetaceae bacterium]